MAYVKLFESILASTIWAEPHATRIVWITMLAMADRDGIVEASVPGLAHFARVGISECEKAIAILSAPDPESRTKDHEGRRINAAVGGWLVLNYEMYRDRASFEERQEMARLRQQRKRDRDKSRDVTHVTPSDSDSDSDSDSPHSPPPGGQSAPPRRFRKRRSAVPHVPNMPLGAESCSCEDCVGFRAKKKA